MEKKGLKMNGKKWMQIFLLTGCILMTLLTVYCITKKEAVNDYVTGFSVKSQDGEIRVNWKLSPALITKNVALMIEGNGNYYKEKITPFENSYAFRQGEHGCLYTISIVMEENEEILLCQRQSMFLEFEQLPNIPTLVIDTVDGEDPTYEVVQAGGINQVGASIINNEYKEGNLSVINKKCVEETSPVKIRVRGNTSATDFDKVPYRLELDTGKDLLGLGADYAHKDWLLLNCGSNMSMYIGTYVSEYAGSVWQPKISFVNVMLNGDWKGLYVLSEPVTEITKIRNFKQNGFIIENDAYWWNHNDVYFKTTHQQDGNAAFLGYTFKYPKVQDTNDETFEDIQSYMEEVESYVYANDSRMYEYIDKDSFVTWILIKDILGHIDAVGSNIYLYCEDFDKTDYQANLLKMGPTCDFDGAFYRPNQLSLQHETDFFWFPELFNNPEFVQAYCEKWDQLSEEFYDDVEGMLQQFLEQDKVAVNQSRRLDAVRWNSEYINVGYEINCRLIFFQQQVNYLDSMTDNMEGDE